jgi:hypothetical protein
MATGVFVSVFVRERASQHLLPYTDSRCPSAHRGSRTVTVNLGGKIITLRYERMHACVGVPLRCLRLFPFVYVAPSFLALLPTISTPPVY